MGLFRNLGRRAERFKQQVSAAAEDEATHGCLDCKEPLYTDHETCPECGSEEVVALEDD